MATKRRSRAEGSRLAPATAKRLDLDGEHGDGRRRARFPKRPANSILSENLNSCYGLFMDALTLRPSLSPPPAFLDAPARRVKCQVSAPQLIDIIHQTVKLSLDNP